MDFNEAIASAALKFKDISGTIRITSHLDADGLTSAAILAKTLEREGKHFNLTIVRSLTKEFLDELKKEDYKTFVFCDLGSGALKEINETLNDRTVFILDHHQPQKVKTAFIHLNPLLFKKEDKELSGAGVAYLFSKQLNEENKDLAYLAVIGAIGDVQEDNGFKGLNNEILEDARDKILVKNGLKMFGAQTRPLHKVLEYSNWPYIPGVTGDYNGALTFLDEIGIELKKDNQFRKLIHLSKEELKKLVDGIIIRRMHQENPEDVLGPIYLLKDEEDESPFKDLREFSTLLNSCGRLNKPSIGIGVCLGSEKAREQAFDLLRKYRKEIVDSLNWFNENKGKSVIEEKGFVIIKAEEYIRDTLIGTMNSILSKSGAYKEGTVILSMAYTIEGNVKCSIREAGYKQVKDLKKILEKILGDIEGQVGGHTFAAGCLFEQKDEDQFIENAKKVLSAIAIEEEVK